MGNQPEDPRTEEKDDFEQETASPLPTREAMSIIDPTLGPKIYEPPDGFSTDPSGEVPDDRYEE